MSSSNFIQRQYEIIQSSYRITKDHERAKADTEAGFIRDKKAAENNWSYVKRTLFSFDMDVSYHRKHSVK